MANCVHSDIEVIFDESAPQKMKYRCRACGVELTADEFFSSPAVDAKTRTRLIFGTMFEGEYQPKVEHVFGVSVLGLEKGGVALTLADNGDLALCYREREEDVRISPSVILAEILYWICCSDDPAAEKVRNESMTAFMAMVERTERESNEQ